ncbi:hypothetical protein ACFY5C_15805 [Streptomyces sp. NPDC012935]|uniref:hypothetical protein n=1 Tax=Streptomyces sp. NPDC012935 TaxID=3364857 RepID=UPI00367B1FD8
MCGRPAPGGAASLTGADQPAGDIALSVGLVSGLSGVLCGALLQAESDRAYVGRVTSVANFFSLGVAPLTFPRTDGAGGLRAGLLRAGDLRRAELPRCPARTVSRFPSPG